MQINGLALRREREKRGWSQDELAARAELGKHGRRTIVRVESTGRCDPKTLTRLAFALGVEKDKLLSPEEPRLHQRAPVPDPLAELREKAAKHPANLQLKIDLALALIKRHDGDRLLLMNEATDLLAEVIDAIRPPGSEKPMTEQWALAQRHLSEAWFFHPNPQQTNHLAKAMDAIEGALAFWKTQKHPSRKQEAERINCLNNLGVILANGATRPDVPRAIEVLREVLRDKDRPTDRQAATMRNLANVYSTARWKDDAEHLEQLTLARKWYEEARKIHTKAKFRQQYGMLSYSISDMWLKIHLLTKNEIDRDEAIDKAFANIREAQAVIPEDPDSIEHANVQFNLAGCYHHKREAKRAPSLNKACDLYEKCLAIYKSVSMGEWALTLYPLAQVKRELAKQPGQLVSQRLRDAIADLKAARGVYPGDDDMRRLLKELHAEYAKPGVRGAYDPEFERIEPRR